MKRIMLSIGAAVLAAGSAYAGITVLQQNYNNTTSLQNYTAGAKAGDVVVMQVAGAVTNGSGTTSFTIDATSQSYGYWTVLNNAPLNTQVGLATAAFFTFTNAIASTNLGGHTIQFGASGPGVTSFQATRMRATGGDFLVYNSDYSRQVDAGGATGENYTFNHSFSGAQSAAIVFGAVGSTSLGATTVVYSSPDLNKLQAGGREFYSTTNAVLGNVTSYSMVFTDASPLTTSTAELATFSFYAIPEPATIGMLGLGGLVVMAVRRFRNRD